MLSEQHPMLLILPHILLLTGASVMVLKALWIKNHTALYLTTQVTLLISLIATVYLLPEAPRILFNNTVIHDQLASLLQCFTLILAMLAIAYARPYIVAHGMAVAEYYVLSLFAILGVMVLISGYHFISLYIGLELMSLPIYTLVAMQRAHTRCTEAAMKYFVMGAIASGMLLYGLSLLYGATKALDIQTVATTIAQIPAEGRLVVIFALVFVIAGIAFKFAAVPFHMWAPDVYHGAPTSVTLFIASIPKLAAVGLAMRLLVEAGASMHEVWQDCLIVLTVLSIGLGNLVAIVQTNIKRLIAYSSIAHMGYLLLGITASTIAGYSASLFYVVSYALMSIGALAVVVIMSQRGEDLDQIADLKGLNQRNPWLAFMLMIILFSMAGIPPTVGFFAKLFVLQALVDAHLVWLAVYALLFAIVGAYYYINIVKVMYFEDSVQNEPIVVSKDSQILITFNGLAVLLLGIFPTTLWQFCEHALLG